MYKVKALKTITYQCLLCGPQKVQLRMKVLSRMSESS